MAATVESLKAKIEKLEKTLARHQSLKAKKQAQLEKAAGPNAAYWLACDIEELEQRIDAATEKIAAAYRALEAAEAAKKAKADKEAAMPEQLREYRDKLADEWNKSELAQRREMLEKGESYYRIDGKVNSGLYRYYVELTSMSEDDIRRRNRSYATAAVENLIARVEKAVGTPQGYSRLYVTKGNWMEGGSAINGYVSGDKGTAEVRSILAGGHNIQRLHVRVLVIEK